MALTFRDIDAVVARNPGANAIAISKADYAALLGTTDSDKTLPSHGKHIEYVAKTPARSLLRIFSDPTVRSGDTYINS